MRLDKALTFAGLTRAEAKKAIAQGRAAVDGKITRDSSAQAEISAVTLDGRKIGDSTEIYIMMNKPEGVVTANEDSRWGTVMDTIAPNLRRKGLGPVGRLDRDVTGLIVLTTDGELAHRLISPKRHVEKVYIAEIEGNLSPENIAELERGIVFKEYTSAPAKAEMIADGMAKITVTEGKFHEVKNLLSRVGHPVRKLRRESIAGVKLDETLDFGRYRALTDAEIACLRKAVDMEEL